jgi:prevent-host-death family protein
MTRLPSAKVREQFADIINRVSYRGERVVLERHGKSVAALVPVGDLELLEALEDKLDLEAARAALAEKGPNVPWARLKRELGL